jgi:succinoglycan biosynthesis protein ExoM
LNRHIAICIATFRRPRLLDELLCSLADLEIPDATTIEIRVIDNDAGASARTVVRRHTDQAPPGRIRYAVVQPSNIACARNAAIEMGPADLLLFIDDDEVAAPDCLVELVGSLDRTGADAVIGFVGGVLPPNTPSWLGRGGFFDHPTGPADEPLHWRGTRCGCTLVRAEWFHDRGFRFDTAFGNSGGEDVDLFARLAGRGAQFTSNPRARAMETVGANRLRFGFLWHRAWRNGLCYHRLSRHDERRRHPAVVFGWRCSRAFGGVIAGLPWLLLARPERCVKGLLSLSLAGGGLVGWMSPRTARTHVSYGEVGVEQCASPFSPTS